LRLIVLRGWLGAGLKRPVEWLPELLRRIVFATWHRHWSSGAPNGQRVRMYVPQSDKPDSLG